MVLVLGTLFGGTNGAFPLHGTERFGSLLGGFPLGTVPGTRYFFQYHLG